MRPLAALALLVLVSDHAAAATGACEYAPSEYGYEMPWLLYADQTCPSETGRVDDAAIFQAQWSWVLAGNSSTSYVWSKLQGRLERPGEIVTTSTEMYWTEANAGTVRRCATTFQTGKCASSSRWAMCTSATTHTSLSRARAT